MLSFDIRALESKAVQVDGELAPDDSVWEEGDPRPAAPLRVTGRLSSAGSDRWYFTGAFEGELATECRRCLVDVRVEAGDEVTMLFVGTDDDEAADDPDVYLVDPKARELDLRPALREHWLLSAPAFAECRPDCKGLCPTCGTDLNTGSCDCVQATSDPRWDALRNAAAAEAAKKGTKK
jgi:uncharacterized protein